jgi:site-specific DNA recombinase
VALRSATEPIDTSTPSGRLIFQMLASFAEYEREAIRERTRAGVRRAFRDGKPMGVLPYAYRASEDGRLEVVEEEAEIVREIFANIANGSTPYREAQRLNTLGVEPPGWRYRSGKWRRKDGEKDGGGGSGRRKRRASLTWSPEAVSNVVRQGAYSGIHEVRFKGEEEPILSEVPAVVSRELQERARAALGENTRRRGRGGDRRYLLGGIVRCAVCGYSCSGHATWSKGKRLSYYTCLTNRKGKVPGIERHGAPYLRAEWLEGEIWSDVRRFLKNPGEVLERVREQLESESAADELETRRASLADRLAAKREEKDRYARLFSQGVIEEDDDEALDHLLDLKNQVANLRLMLEVAEAELAEKSVPRSPRASRRGSGRFGNA